MVDTKEKTRPWWEGLVWPLLLSFLLLFASATYVLWKCYHPKSGDWNPGDLAGMLTAVSIADVGQFVSGVAGALVFIWIIFTYSAQREELALQRGEMHAQRKEFEKLAGEAHTQSQLLEETSKTNKRDAFIRLLALRERELALTTAELLRVLARDGVEVDQINRLWHEYERGEQHVFFRGMIARMVQGKHRQFMERVEQVMNGRETLEFIRAQAQRTLDDADQLDLQMAELCHNTPWAMMATSLTFLLNGQGEGVEELPSEFVGH